MHCWFPALLVHPTTQIPAALHPSVLACADVGAWGRGWAIRAVAVALKRNILVLDGNLHPMLFLYLARTDVSQDVECLMLPTLNLSSMQPRGAYPRELFAPDTIVLLSDGTGEGPCPGGTHFNAVLPAGKHCMHTEPAVAAAKDAGFLVAETFIS